ncbi:MAG TPA: RidA family protein [Acidimicrobiales bacterium]|nr:RidA family protein [Acidimicrobiales bacterium]
MSASHADAVEERLGDLGLRLPPAMAPLARYRWATRDGNHIYLAGHGPFESGRAVHVGKVGVDLSVEEGYEANRFVALTILRTLKEELGTLDLVERPLAVTNYVNVGPGIGDSYMTVGDGSTDLWVDLWGEDVGLCARMTVGVSELPWSVPTAIVSTWLVKGDA